MAQQYAYFIQLKGRMNSIKSQNFDTYDEAYQRMQKTIEIDRLTLGKKIESAKIEPVGIKEQK